jgi:hypothetical protein
VVTGGLLRTGMRKTATFEMTPQNLTLAGKKVRHEWVNPFDKIANLASRQTWLPRENSASDLILNGNN